MKMKGVWITLSVLLVLALVLGVFGCASSQAPATTAPAASPSASPSPSPAPSPKPTVAPTSVPTATPTAAPTPAQPQKIKWKGQTVYAPVHSWSAGAGHNIKYAGTTGTPMYWRDWVYQITDGQLDIEIAPVGTYVDTMGTFDAVQTGVLDFAGLWYAGYAVGKMPEAHIACGIPFAWQTMDESWDGFYNWGIYNIINEAFNEQKVQWWPCNYDGYYHYGCNFVANSVKDIAGKKMRATGIWADYTKNLGGSAVNIPAAELYMALKLGTVDGAIYGLPGLEDWKLKEVWKSYVVSPNPNAVIASYICNLASFKKLPQSIQDKINAGTPYINWSVSQNYLAEAKYMAGIAAKEYGFKAITWSAEDTAIATAAGIATWDSLAGLNARNKKMIDIIRMQAKAMGKIK